MPHACGRWSILRRRSPRLAISYTKGTDSVAPEGLVNLAQKQYEKSEHGRLKRQKTKHFNKPPRKATKDNGPPSGES